MKKKLLVISILLALILIIQKNVIFQEGNPIPVVIGILKLELTSNDLVEISENKYIVKNDLKEYIKLKENQGYEYVEQLGSGYVFVKEEKSYISQTKQYTRRYRIINDFK